MRPRSILFSVSATAVLLCPFAGSASAAPHGPSAPHASPHWTRVTATGLANSTDIGLARGGDGVLHVLWTTGNTGTYRVADTPIAANGKLGKTVVLASHLWSANDPDAAATSAGVDAFWNGQRTSSLSKGAGTWRETRPLHGGKWKLASITPAVSFLWSSAVSAAPGTANQPWVAFGYSGGMGVLHYGRPEQGLPVGGCCDYNEGIGTDGRTGTAWLTYYSIVKGDAGVFDQQLTSTGTRTGPAHRMPGSATGGNSIFAAERITATGRPGARSGVYSTYVSGYPSARGVDLYRFGSAKAITVAKFGAAAGILGSTPGADPSGHVWVAWWGGKIGAPTLFVSRSNTAVTGFGKAVRVALPPGASALYKVYISAQSRRLDVLALLIVNFKIAYWTTQVPAPR